MSDTPYWQSDEFDYDTFFGEERPEIPLGELGVDLSDKEWIQYWLGQQDWWGDDSNPYDWGGGWEDEWTRYKNWVNEMGFYDALTPFGGGDTRKLAKSAFSDLFLSGYGTEMQDSPAEDPDSYQLTPIYDENNRVIRLEDSEGNVVFDYTSIWEKLDAANELGSTLPTLQEWMDQNGYGLVDIQNSGILTDLQNLVAQLQAGASEEEIAQAVEYGAQALGVTAEEYRGLVDEMFNVASGGQQVGLTDEYRGVRENQIRRDMQVREERAQRMIESIYAGSGSATRALMAADQARAELNSYELQQWALLAEQEFEAIARNQQTQEQMWEHATETMQMSKEDFLNRLTESKALALQGYAQQISAMIDVNSQYLSMYGQELARIQTMVDNYYKAVNAELGVSEDVRQYMEDYFNQQMAAWDAAMEAMFDELELAEMTDSDVWKDIMDSLSVITDLINAIMSVVGAIG